MIAFAAVAILLASGSLTVPASGSLPTEAARAVTAGPDFTVEPKTMPTHNFKFGISGHVRTKSGDRFVPVPGLQVYAKDPMSEHIYSSVRTNKDGRYLLPVPKRGNYLVVLDRGIGAWVESSTPAASMVNVK